jgi:hypothetical protein
LWSRRLLNDDPPDLYIATVLWNFVLPDFAANQGVELPANLPITEQELVDRLRDGYGYAAPVDLVRRALEFLRVARLCEPAANGWRIYYRNLGRVSRELSEALLNEHFSKANKARRIRPAREAEPVAPNAEAAEAERADDARVEAVRLATPPCSMKTSSRTSGTRCPGPTPPNRAEMSCRQACVTCEAARAPRARAIFVGAGVIAAELGRSDSARSARSARRPTSDQVP